MSAPKKPAKKKNGYKMPDPLPPGALLQDVFKKQWLLGPSIAKGGFGEIYSAKESDAKSNNCPYVIKIEPHGNGPLFVEMHFYARNCKDADIAAFKADEKLKSLGIPKYIGSGSHIHNGEKYRFLVMEKFATDVWKLFKSNNSQMPQPTVFKLALQMLDALHYIHSKGYVHADLKGANILLSAQDSNQAYLVDFGLASKFSTEKEFKPNPKRMHDGTIEYLSRDAHLGVQTRRGDIEILAYNMIHWWSGKLPWEALIAHPDKVQKSKEDHMKNVDKFTKLCFPSQVPKQLVDLLHYINKMQFNEAPDYKKLRKLFLDGLKACGEKENSALLFTASNKRKSAPDHDKEEVQVKKAPARRARRINTIQTVDELKTGAMETQENGVVMNKEMMRIKALADGRKKTVEKPKISARNRRKNFVISSSDEEEEILPVSTRIRRKRELMEV